MNTYASYNWCGGRLKVPPGKKFTKVQATWQVPEFGENPPDGETHYAAIFVGLDGGSEWLSQNLFQAGVAQIVSTDAAGTTTQDCHAWYLWDPTGGLWDPNYSNNKVPGFPVSPGDTVTVILEYKVATNQGSAQFSKNGQALPPILFNVDTSFVGDTMEWIMERPADRNTTTPRKKLGKVNVKLTNAFGFTSDGTQVAPKDGDNLTMEADDSTNANQKPLATATLGPDFVDIKFKAHQ
jgi:peptidase A4-like protein